MIKVAIYTRVSTQDQSCEMQLAELRKYATDRGWQVVGEYIDYVTGDVKKRIKRGHHTRYDDLLADAEKGVFQAVLVWKFDRFARSVVHLESALAKFKALNIDFISTTQNIDTTTSVGKLFFTMLAAFAEFERSLIVERVRAGLRLIQDTGKNSKGEPVTLGRPEQISQQEKTRIVDEFVNGATITVIASALDMPMATVYSVVKRSVLPCPHGKYRCKHCLSLGRTPIRIDAGSVTPRVGGYAR